MTVVRLDEGLFAAFAMLNATGYNSENGWEYTAARKAVRLRLAANSALWRERLDEVRLLEPLQRAGGAMLMDILPFLSPPPDFLPVRRDDDHLTSWQRESLSSLQGIEPWLRRFYMEEPVGLLWSENLPAYEAAMRGLQPACPFLDSLVSSFNPQDTPRPEIIIMPNLLDAKGRGYSASTKRLTVLFLGPLDDPVRNEVLATHELLHRWADAAAEQAVREAGGADPMPAARALFRIVAESYPDLSIWVAETLVRSATAWVLPDLHPRGAKDIPQSVSDNDRIGFVGAVAAYRYLEGGGKRTAVAMQEAARIVLRTVQDECRRAKETL